MTDRKAQKRRLERAGLRFYSGWAPADSALGAQFELLTQIYAVRVAAILAEPPKPHGRPRKTLKGEMK
jgi:hypothetical protein